jgi:hypothetical protein
MRISSSGCLGAGANEVLHKMMRVIQKPQAASDVDFTSYFWGQTLIEPVFSTLLK